MASSYPYLPVKLKKHPHNIKIPKQYPHEKNYTLILLPVHIMPGNTG